MLNTKRQRGGRRRGYVLGPHQKYFNSHHKVGLQINFTLPTPVLRIYVQVNGNNNILKNTLKKRNIKT